MLANARFYKDKVFITTKITENNQIPPRWKDLTVSCQALIIFPRAKPKQSEQ